LSNIRDGTAGGQAHAHINGAKLWKIQFTKINTEM